MAELVLFGAGKVTEVIYRHLRAAAQHSVVAFTVDKEYIPESETLFELPVVPFEQVEQHFPPDRYAMLIAIGYHNLNSLRAEKYAEARAKGYRLESYISPRAGVGDWLDAGDNCIILDDAIVEPGAKLGNNVVLWSGVLIGHHTTIEDHSWVAAHAVFGGSARLGASSFVGLNATVGHEVDLGARSLIGAGALVMKCQDDGSVFIEKDTELFRLDSERFLKISKLR